MDTPIHKLLSDIGIIYPECQETAINHLINVGVISRRRRRINIANTKLKRAEDCLKEGFVWHCSNGDCKQAARVEERNPLLVDKSQCFYCGGSGDKQALQGLANTMEAEGLSRILVVGGTDNKGQEIRKKSQTLHVQWRFIDGTKAKDDRYYRPHRDWADVIIIWSSTPLDHRVSGHFTGRSDDRVITAERRGISSLCESVIRYLRQ